MALPRNVGLRGLKYKGGVPMLSWVLHRITGLGIVLFVGIHIIVSFFMQQVGGDFATLINTIYQSIFFQVFVYFCVIFHALNGLRIIILDVWPKLLQYQREMIWLQWLIFIPVYGLTIFLMIMNSVQGS